MFGPVPTTFWFSLVDRLEKYMSVKSAEINSGLEGVVVAASAISNVQGKRGDLSYRGQSINHWVEQDFASVAAAVIDWPNLYQTQELAQLLFEWGELTEFETQVVLNHTDHHPMAVLQGPKNSRMEKARCFQGLRSRPGYHTSLLL